MTGTRSIRKRPLSGTTDQAPRPYEAAHTQLARRLAAFGKTELLLPGASQTLTLTFGPEQLESFDEVSAA